MKALIRNVKETVAEDSDIPGIDWETGMPLTNPDWAGGPYTLIENYTPSFEDPEESVIAEPNAELNAKRDAEIAELKARLAALENGA